MRLIDIGANFPDAVFRGIYHGKAVHVDDFSAMLKRCQQVNLKVVISTSTSAQDYHDNNKIIEEFSGVIPRIFTTLGVHPSYCQEVFRKKCKSDWNLVDGYFEEMLEIFRNDPVNRDNLVAIGECGLDYARLFRSGKECQLKFFQKHFDLLSRLEATKRPAMFLHSRDCVEDFTSILKRNRDVFPGGVVHSFTGSVDEAKELLEFSENVFIGLNGCSLRDEKGISVASMLPLDRIMIESDAPYCEMRPSHASSPFLEDFKWDILKPVDKSRHDPSKPVKGRNEPTETRRVLRVISKLRGIDEEELSEIIYNNTLKLFPEIKNDENDFRSPQSDVEVPKTRQRRNDSSDSLASKLDPLAVTKENMSTTRRPADSDFTQQRLFGWQPILTPYNVLPVLFILGLIFVVLGVVFLTTSMGVHEYVVDYTSSCIGDRCTASLNVEKTITGPVAVYYRLTNFYQNNRLYAMSKSDEQLKGMPITDPASLKDCHPLDKTADGKIIYPCGLIANSYFTDELKELKSASGKLYPILSKEISWPGDSKLYGKTRYNDLENIVPPPDWKKGFMGVNAEGKYDSFPDLSQEERFQNWMKISGLPTFRKLYGRIEQNIPVGEYELIIKGNYNVKSYQGTKSFVFTSTNWAGGKNDALGLGFIVVGGLLLLLGLIFLVMFIMAPRKVGDVSYLSWYAENSGDPLAESPTNEDEDN